MYNIQSDALMADNLVELGTPLSASPSKVAIRSNTVTVLNQLIEDTTLSKQMVISTGGALTVRSYVETIPPQYGPVATDWASRVVTNGGAAPSDNTKLALDVFAKGLDTAGLTSLMVAVNCIVPDNLIAAITPLIKVAGNDPWTNTNVVAGDLTVDGLIGNASNKRLDTGVNALTNYASSNIGITAYAMSDTFTDFRCDIGAYVTSTDTSRIYLPFSTTKVRLACFGGGEAGGGYIESTPLTGIKGYYSGNRTSSTYYAIYQANSSTPHAVGAFGTNEYGARPNTSYYVLAVHDTSSGPSYSDKRLSFVAFHYGLSAAQSSDFYDLVQAMRVSLGGGYV